MNLDLNILFIPSNLEKLNNFRTIWRDQLQQKAFESLCVFQQVKQL